MKRPLYLPSMSGACAIGMTVPEILQSLFTGTREGLVPRPDLISSSTPVGSLPAHLKPLPECFARWDCRNNRLLAHLADEIRPAIDAEIARVGRERVAVVIGTSTSGIAEGSSAMQQRLQDGAWPEGFRYEQQETGGGADFLARYLNLAGPAFVVATACSSSAKAFASARRLIAAGLAESAIVGGADTLCALTLSGFHALGALAPDHTNPFSKNRSGINIGEGGALFIVSKQEADICLAGIGESSDAYHVSAPDPDGRGSQFAMEAALRDAGLSASDIGYVNLHGTGTALNDSMESLAMARLFPHDPPCSSTKSMTGHTLGAAGALEAAFIWLTLSKAHNPDGRLPIHLWDGEHDPALPVLNLTQGTTTSVDSLHACLSNSFAFGGSNCTLILQRTQ